MLLGHRRCLSALAGVHDSVAAYYGKVLSSSKDLKTSACTTSSKPSPQMRAMLGKVPKAVTDKYYGCGSPLPSGGLEGLTVLDLGSGSGRDCYVASQLVGPNGKVVGLDMTDEQLDTARRHTEEFCASLGYPSSNMRFVKGFIERISEVVPNETVDLIISNCVVNLSPDKPSVIKGMFSALREGGEALFSDVYVDRRLSSSARQHHVLWGECLAGALYEQDFLRIAHAAGFADPRVVARSPVDVLDPELSEIVGNAKFQSVTYRLFKLRDLETKCEDYGQVAVYLGTLPGAPHAYELDDHHRFETGRPMLVCGNTASMVGESWLRKHFVVRGDRSVHFGLFDCSSGPAPLPTLGSTTSCSTPSSVEGGCC